MPKVVEFPKKEPSKPLVEAVAALMTEAVSGNLKGVVLIRFSENGKFGIKKVGVLSDLEVIGALAFAQHDIMLANKPE